MELIPSPCLPRWKKAEKLYRGFLLAMEEEEEEKIAPKQVAQPTEESAQNADEESVAAQSEEDNENREYDWDDEEDDTDQTPYKETEKNLKRQSSLCQRKILMKIRKICFMPVKAITRQKKMLIRIQNIQALHLSYLEY